MSANQKQHLINSSVFYYELKTGDIAIIVDNNGVAFAYIGEYYESSFSDLTVKLEKEVLNHLEKADPNTDAFDCPYVKRRKTTLIKTPSTNLRQARIFKVKLPGTDTV